MKTIAKPFLKWAGGKSQLIPSIQQLLPKNIQQYNFTYIEPFVGSGAILFWMLQHFPTLQRAIINDINQDLINTYQIIASQPDQLISALRQLEREFHSLEGSETDKKKYYTNKRSLYNQRIATKTEQAALFVFLNRTCFNGLYRVNRNNEFNVPMGSYKRPTICDQDNLIAVSKALQKVDIRCGDYQKTLPLTEERALFYFDPPYKPLNSTSSFNSYARFEFDDHEQIRLRDFCSKLDSLEYSWILSNSDVKNEQVENTFFDDLYSNFIITRVDAKRSINSNAKKRGILKELLISNGKDFAPSFN